MSSTANTDVLEVVAEPLPEPTLDDILRDHCTEAGVDDTHFLMLVEAGLATNDVGALTDAGITKAEELGIPITEIHILVLGRQISAINKKGVKRNLAPGSELLVVFGGRTKNYPKLKFHDCLAGDEFPPIRVFKHHLDSFKTARWPTNMPMKGRYLEPTP